MTHKLTSDNRLPPGQQLIAENKWPIIGERQPASSPEPWSLTIIDKVSQTACLSPAEFAALPRTTITTDIHCVTRWSKYDVEFSGVLLSDLLDKYAPNVAQPFVSFVSRSDRNHSSSLSLADALEHQTIIADQVNGQPLPTEHGGPFRNIVPGKYFYKSVKWLTRIELLEQDRLGYWEAETGYHNHADPWKEERYMAPSLDRRTVKRLISQLDFSGHDLRSLEASRRALDGLKATSALLRDANFRGASLTEADFSGANLSNAHFQDANLVGARFFGADIEGANFEGANLAGADFSKASLIGASFCDGDSDNPDRQANITPSTKFDAEQLARLTDVQRKFVTQKLKE